MWRSPVSALALLVAVGLAGSAPGRAAAASPHAPRPSASVVASAVEVLVPGRPVAASTPTPPGGGSESAASFAYPRNGSLVLAGDVRASSLAHPALAAEATASARGQAAAADVSLFDGEITADAVQASASAAAGVRRGSGRLGSVRITNLQALGRHVARGPVALGDWGVLTVSQRTVAAQTPAAGRVSYSGTLAGIAVTLDAAHDGLPAGTVIELAVLAVRAAPPPPPPPPKPVVRPELLPGDRPQLLPAPTGPLLGVPQEIAPPLAAGPYVFPVFGTIRLGGGFGMLAPGGGYQHADTIGGSLGEPVLAASAGTLFAVGWGRDQGNHVWLRDRQGNEFAYSHLSAFASVVAAGAHVSAGEVIGFMGSSGASSASAPNLGFEVHPVSLLFLGSQGAVDPTLYLESWRRAASIALAAGPGWAPSVPGTLQAPEPGAVLVGSSTIGSSGRLAADAHRGLAVGAS